MTDNALKYIACSFSRGGRTYTYHADFPVKVGDMVCVESRDGTMKVKVEEVSEIAPKFPTKPAFKLPAEDKE